ncbi:CTLH/CRA C-terminal to LisH motif domain protein [Theileria parva strain Muguga]|uniref:CTLH domain-containing protein n=1 Tax=Theileria parva TaxID=5875 RepID=Q4N9D2_THEPA|nr:CTLH/CRA C-terminal to LisH motif domain protein [Theileria parva strain Muguga]EAN33426.1 CTLH/CRA C-terminal to LisH motif domain protein [Theileria parva strain Muguga]|eukprot:XP_765709.1 hypothetical protein [Theileria parva strain Muguga]
MTEESLFLYHSTTPSKNQMVMKNMDLDLCLNLMKGIEVSEKDLQGVIANYLFINMYEDTYKFFIQETHFNDDGFKPTISERKFIRNSIMEGRIMDAINQINQIDRNILNENSNLLFVLMLYRLVDIILSGDLHTAIKFAKEEISSCIKKDPNLLTKLEEAMSLLAFQNLNSPEALEIIKKIQKPDEISNLVDNSLIAYYNLDPKPILENIIKETLWVESQLESKPNSYSLKLSNISRCGFKLSS